jgi:uncharacterized membrane protein SpoIIM required for sporulation
MMRRRSLLKKLRVALVIAEREVRDQFRDWRIIFPILGLTLFFPFLMNLTAQQMLDFVTNYGATIIGERMVPFLLMIVGFFPISVSLVIALESFVGEKERSSIEPLLNTPLEDWQLYVGKLLSSTVPPLVGSYLGMAIYLIGLAYKGITLPPADLLFLIFILTTVQAFMMVSGAVVVSSQATSVRAANLLASFIVIPMALLIQGESVVMFWADYQVLWMAVLGVIVLGILLIRIGLAHFQREELLGREIDVLNFRWGWQVFWRRFTGSAHSVREWYRVSLPQALREMRLSILVTLLVGITGLLVGYLGFRQYFLRVSPDQLQDVYQNAQLLLQAWPFGDFRPVLGIFWQNSRALLVGFVLGYLSLGVLGLLPLMATMGIAGYLLMLLSGNGLPLITFAALIVPHGIFEIPAAILSTAAVLHSGAILVTPNSTKTVGEVWLTTLADWFKIVIGLVIPLLFLAAIIEAWITPRIALLFMR